MNVHELNKSLGLHEANKSSATCTIGSSQALLPGQHRDGAHRQHVKAEADKRLVNEGNQHHQRAPTAALQHAVRHHKLCEIGCGVETRAHFATNSLPCCETSGQGSIFRSTGSLRTRSKISPSVRPQNGGIPDSMMYRMTPTDHRSASHPYAPCSTSGAK